MALSKLEQQLVDQYTNVNYPRMEPEPEPPAEGEMPFEPYQLAQVGPTRIELRGMAVPDKPQVRGRTSGSQLTMSDAGTALFDMGAGTLRGAVAQTLGLPGDIEMLGRGLRAVFNRPEDQSRLDAFLAGLEEKTRLPTTERMGEILPPVVPPGAPNAQMRQHSAKTAQAFGELAPLPGAIDVGVKGVKAGARAVGQAIDQAMTEGTGPAARLIPKAVRPMNVVQPGQRLVGEPISVDKVQRSKNYKAWAEGADVKANDGKPKVLYHATTHDFDTFSLERANPENHYGKAFYLTDSVDDANKNYAGIGPDLQQRIELRAERLADETMDMDEQDIVDMVRSAGIDVARYEKDGLSPEILKEIASKELTTHGGAVMPVFAKIKNPVKVGTKDETVFSIETQFDDAGDVVSESGSGVNLINAIREVASEYNLSDLDIERAMSKITDEMYDGIKAKEVDRILRSEINDVYTPDGEYASPGQFIADVFQRMGFDGIEMNAEKYFGPRQGAFGTRITGMEGVKGATHYILFDSRNIKSAVGNRGTFDPKDPNILRGVAVGGPSAGAATMQDKEQK